MANGPSFYPLVSAQQLVREGRVDFEGRALIRAKYEFGWLKQDIIDAFLDLTPAHYDKSAPHGFIRDADVQYYKAPGLHGENVYMHFYLNPGSTRIVIDSCHTLVI